MTENITLFTESQVVVQTFGDNWWGVALAIIGVLIILVAYYHHKGEKKDDRSDMRD